MKIGLIGHSEGGLIASIVGAKEKDLAFIVSTKVCIDNGNFAPDIVSLLESSRDTTRTRANDLDNLLYIREFTNDQVLHIIAGNFGIVIRELKSC